MLTFLEQKKLDKKHFKGVWQLADKKSKKDYNTT